MLQVQDVRFHHLLMQTRFPFRYGIASMTESPYLMVSADVEIDGTTVSGMSADGLPPKWFTKNPDTTFEEDDLPQMLRVIRNAADLAANAGQCAGFFAWWKDVYDGQSAWAVQNRIPPLLAGLGVSLLERAVLDAFCRATGATLHQAVLHNQINVDFAAVRSSLAGTTAKDFLLDQPLGRVKVRHTVGLGDPLTAADVGEGERPEDQLPFTFEENVRHYGLTHFKIKLSGNLDKDHHRLEQIAQLLHRLPGPAARFTLDGNENFQDITVFRSHWESHRESPAIRRFIEHSLLFVEQPLHRDFALVDEVRSQLSDWAEAPPMIIDESDADFTCLPRALSLGYTGTSHKNCKGIIKGLTNAATVAGERNAGRSAVLSAEDLGNVGPIALLQDLAMVACLGIDHVERNGHHYYRGLSMWSETEQDRVLTHHPDLYGEVDATPCVCVESGLLNLASVNSAPFGVCEHPDVTQLDVWDF